MVVWVCDIRSVDGVVEMIKSNGSVEDDMYIAWEEAKQKIEILEREVDRLKNKVTDLAGELDHPDFGARTENTQLHKEIERLKDTISKGLK